VYSGLDPLTGRELRHRKTVKTETEAQIVLGRLLEQAEAGRRPDSRVTVGELIASYLDVAELDLSTRHTYEGYIRRTILPALGSIELRKVRGPMLDTFYARLRRCGNLACNGRPFTEHTSFPPLVVVPGRRPAWQQVAGTIREAIRSGRLAPGDQLPSAREMADRQRIRLTTAQHALAALAEEGLIKVRHGLRSVVRGEEDPTAGPRLRRIDPKHDCARSGCQKHVCKPMSATTVRQIHAILSGAFTAAVRWEWIDRNPATTAKLPTAKPRSPSSPEPDVVAKVIAAARDMGLELLALYLWLAAVTGARRGELCGLQWADVDLERGVVHVAYSYLVLPGVKVRKDTKTHQVRRLAIDEITVAVLAERWEHVRELLNQAGVTLSAEACPGGGADRHPARWPGQPARGLAEGDAGVRPPRAAAPRRPALAVRGPGRVAVHAVGHEPAPEHRGLARPARVHRRGAPGARPGRGRHPDREGHRDRQVP
jgi:integrase